MNAGRTIGERLARTNVVRTAIDGEDDVQSLASESRTAESAGWRLVPMICNGHFLDFKSLDVTIDANRDYSWLLDLDCSGWSGGRHGLFLDWFLGDTRIIEFPHVETRGSVGI